MRTTLNSRSGYTASPCVDDSALPALPNSPNALASNPRTTGPPRYNIAPTQDIEVIRQHAEVPKRFGSQMRWGLIPSWAKDASIGYKMINARAETVAMRGPSVLISRVPRYPLLAPASGCPPTRHPSDLQAARRTAAVSGRCEPQSPKPL